MLEGSGIAPFDVPCEPGSEGGGERAKRVEPERSAQGAPGFLLAPHPQPDTRRRKAVGSRRLAISMTCGRVI